MSDYQASIPASAGFKRYVPDLPLVIWMVLLTLLLGLMGGLPAEELVAGFNHGFGRALGEFALILLPSFTLAAALSRQNLGSDAAGRMAAVASPIAGAGMICPDTAYAALSPAAGRYKLDLAFGAYAGFKLLYPAGPLIVAAGLGIGATQVEPVLLLVTGVTLALPVWFVGALWGRWTAGEETVSQTEQSMSLGNLFLSFAPFALMAGLLLFGGIVGKTGIDALDFLLMPKGALLAVALVALLQVTPDQRRDCLDSAVRRTGSLLLVIGAASAFGSVLTGMVALDQIVPAGSGLLTLLALFALTILFKLAQGSSMATFAAIAPVAAPIVSVSGVNPIAAIFAICLGSFVAILPNDSYYWLVRRDALADAKEGRAIWILSGGAILQAAIGMVLLLAGVMIWA